MNDIFKPTLIIFFLSLECALGFIFYFFTHVPLDLTFWQL